MTTKKKTNDALFSVFEIFDELDAECCLLDKRTGEKITLDSATLFAGIQAGLVLAAGMIDEPKLTKKSKIAAVVSSIETASQIYIRRTERKASDEGHEDA